MRLRSIVMVVLAVCLFGALAPGAWAAAPPMSEAVIRSATFESASASDTLDVYSSYDPYSTNSAPPATWGIVTTSHNGGTHGLWCAGSVPADWPSYPLGTRGDATVWLPDATLDYSSTVHFAYISPDGPNDVVVNPFIVNWASLSPTASVDPGGYIEPFGQTLSWASVVRTRGAAGNNPPLTAGWLRFQFLSAPFQSGGGKGVTIDDVQVTGYVFGPPNSAAAVRDGGDPTQVHVSWAKPYRVNTTTPDSRTVYYRVWRHDMTDGSWTEVTTNATGSTGLTDTGVSAYRAYQYGVQAYPSTTDTSTWGVLSTTASVTALPAPTFQIVPSAGAGGSISPSTTQTVTLDGDSATFTVTPSAGYDIADVKVDGSSIGSPTVYQFTHVSASHTIAATFVARPITKAVARLSGVNRYVTAIQTMQSAFPGWSGVRDLVLASGDYAHQPDALTAAGLAGAYGGPLLLVPATSLDANVRAAIAAMPSGVRLHVVGGTPSVSDAVLAKLRAIPSVKSVDRIYGTDRYATGVAVATRMKAVLGSAFPHTALVASGANQALLEPLIASTVSARNHYPVLLVAPSSAPASTKNALVSLGLSTRYLVGNPSTASEAVRSAVGVLVGNRISGADVNGDAAAFATRAVAEGWLTNAHIGFASAIPDAATGGLYMGRRGGPMLLVTPTSVPTVTSDYLSANHAAIADGTVFGGTPSVSDAVLGQLVTLSQ